MTLTFNAGPAKVPVTATTTGTDPTATSSGSGTAASFTYPAGARLFLLSGSNGPASANTVVPRFAVSGIGGTASLEWRRVGDPAQTLTGGGYASSSIWTSVVPPDGRTGTVTVTYSGGAQFTSGAEAATFAVVYFTDVGTPGLGQSAYASNSSGAPSVAMTGLTSGSFVLAAVGDWSAAGTSATETPGGGQTAIADGWSSGNYAAHLWRTTTAIGGTTQTMSLTAPAAENYNMVAVEVLAAGSLPTQAEGSRNSDGTNVMLGAVGVDLSG